MKEGGRLPVEETLTMVLIGVITGAGMINLKVRVEDK